MVEILFDGCMEVCFEIISKFMYVCIYLKTNFHTTIKQLWYIIIIIIDIYIFNMQGPGPVSA